MTERPLSRRETWDERHAAREPIESAEPDATLVDEVGPLPPGRALDLGAGDGRNAVWLAGHGWRTTAVDFSAVALARGRALADATGAVVDWRQADLLEWEPPEAAYELVTLFFIHLPPSELGRVLAAAAAAVAPGGILLVVGHDRSNLAEGVGGPQNPDVLFTAGELASRLPAGFAVERATAVRRGRGTERAPINAILRARRLPTEAVRDRALAREGP